MGLVRCVSGLWGVWRGNFWVNDAGKAGGVMNFLRQMKKPGFSRSQS